MLTITRQTPVLSSCRSLQRREKQGHAAPVLERYLTTGAVVASDHIRAADRNLQMFSAQTLLAPLLHLSLFDPLRSTCRHVYPFLS
jgi:hypothetical protein